MKRGASIVVCDRATPIARLVPYESDDDDGIKLLPPTRPIGDLKRLKPVRMRKRVDVARLLRQEVSRSVRDSQHAPSESRSGARLRLHRRMTRAG